MTQCWEWPNKLLERSLKSGTAARGRRLLPFGNSGSQELVRKTKSVCKSCKNKWKTFGAETRHETSWENILERSESKVKKVGTGEIDWDGEGESRPKINVALEYGECKWHQKKKTRAAAAEKMRAGREKGSFNRKLQREVRMQKTEEREENMMKIDQSFAALANEMIAYDSTESYRAGIDGSD
jgi:hypothetical protein